MRFAGHSHETPRRLWLSIHIGEIRLYRYGFEIFLGSYRRFLCIEFGSDSHRRHHIYWVTTP